jgi:alkylated DNA repair dioxygenase AlkB
MELPQGLTIIKDFINEHEENNLIASINLQKWNTKLKRYTQHYGYEYNYKTRTITNKDYLGELPIWSNDIIKKIMDTGKIKNPPDQIIVNRYLPGEGISPHIDTVKIFDGQIYSLSLGSNCVMKFKKGNITKNIYLSRGSLLLMEGDARYKWTHSIEPVKSDKICGIEFNRGVRYSLTFRKVILSE